MPVCPCAGPASASTHGAWRSCAVMLALLRHLRAWAGRVLGHILPCSHCEHGMVPTLRDHRRPGSSYRHGEGTRGARPHGSLPRGQAGSGARGAGGAGSGEDLLSIAAFQAGWQTLSAGAQLGAKLGAKKANASAEREVWQPLQGAETCQSELCCRVTREGGVGQPAGCFWLTPAEDCWADLCVNIRKDDPGWGTVQLPPGQATLRRCPAALSSMLGSPVFLRALRLIPVLLLAQHVPRGALLPCSPSPSGLCCPWSGTGYEYPSSALAAGDRTHLSLGTGAVWHCGVPLPRLILGAACVLEQPHLLQVAWAIRKAALLILHQLQEPSGAHAALRLFVPAQHQGPSGPPVALGLMGPLPAPDPPQRWGMLDPTMGCVGSCWGSVGPQAPGTTLTPPQALGDLQRAAC